MDDDVTLWVNQVALEDPRAAEALWKLYQDRLMVLARRKLGDHRRRAADEEDIALSAFKSFCLGATAGRFPQLDDRDDFWKLLVTITARKAAAELRRQYAKKRGGGAVVGESIFAKAGTSESPAGIQGMPDNRLTPELAVMMGDECERLLDLLSDESLQRVALLKLEGYTNEEIRKLLGCSTATIERKLARIRQKWQSRETP
jgi:DNA-directed RNA polymerase specialized sigma24 family protein